MKKVFIVTYHFPPEGGPAVQRVLKFVKYLPHYGYVPIVLSAKHPLKTVDPTLLEDIPPQAGVFRTKDWGAYIPHDVRKIMKRMYVPDNQALWRYTATKRGIEIIAQENAQLLFSSSPPHSVHLIAQEMAHKTGLPWVADFRDEWTSDPNFQNSSSQELQKKLEEGVLNRCSALTTIQKNARDNFAQSADHEKIFVIRNGFDPDDFASIDRTPEKNPRRLTIAYSGRFTKKSSPDSFFQALDSICRQEKTLQKNIALKIIGRPGNKKWTGKYPLLKEIVDFIPYQPHKECLSLMKRSDVLLLLANNLQHSEVFPAKMYEYFYLKKPILAVVSYPGELTSLLKEYGNAYIGYDSDIKTIEDAFHRLLADWREGTLSESVSDDFVNQFNRNLQTRQLAAVFDTLIASKNN